MASAHDPTISSSGAVVFSQFFWPAALQQLTGLLADGTWLPTATIHFAAMTAALLASWMAVQAGDRICLVVWPSAGLAG
jgi:hypothetical protein